MNKKRREHLKNLIIHSSKATLQIPNGLLPHTKQSPGSDKTKQTQNEIKEALNFLKNEENIHLTTEKKEEYTKIKLEAK